MLKKKKGKKEEGPLHIFRRKDQTTFNQYNHKFFEE